MEIEKYLNLLNTASEILSSGMENVLNYKPSKEDANKVIMLMKHPLLGSDEELSNLFNMAAHDVERSVKEKTGCDVSLKILQEKFNVNFDMNMMHSKVHNHKGLIVAHMASSTVLDQRNIMSDIENIKTMYAMGLHSILFSGTVDNEKYTYTGMSFAEYINGEGTAQRTFNHVAPLHAESLGQTIENVKKAFPMLMEQERPFTQRLINEVKSRAKEGYSWEGMLSDTDLGSFRGK